MEVVYAKPHRRMTTGTHHRGRMPKAYPWEPGRKAGTWRRVDPKNPGRWIYAKHGQEIIIA
jgi:hypothetical protein